MRPLVIAYIAFGIFGLFFDQITSDLLSLGIRSEVVNIVSKGIGATVLGIGTVALAKGLELPPIGPKKDEDTFAP